ncbi:hypothetical protein [Rhodococcus sp. 14-2483-1-2]|uniref:hypothetical protein n=1 Tax=Rhodococcus sp. 14-2483-1-2 TaxID=2023147 RepID=UPI00114008E6|nr:hypothetical protein [Rhodococcus sp. 14-2483-1-2]
MDFDAKHSSPAQVDADVELVLSWLHECGARTVTDRSTSGGRHVLVPLAANAPLRVDNLRELMSLLADRLVTFDCTPMLNAATGCITPPGSQCREGGHRRLDGPLDDAIAAFNDRSEPGVVARLVAMLGGGTERRHLTPVAAVTASLIQDERLIGAGKERRLHPRFHRATPMPAAVEHFATAGKLDPRWRTKSEARQSVITHAVLRGASTADISEAISTDQWPGVSAAYDRYGKQTPAAIERDVNKALTWAAANAHQFHVIQHKNKHTGGDGSFLKDLVRTNWLARALLWIDREFSGRNRPALQAVVQALAYGSALAGELVEGVPVVAIGGRSLSHAAGLLSEDSVWAALRVLRDAPGSPVLLVAHGTGRDADRYALTTPVTSEPDSAHLVRARVEPVHPAWSVLGLRGRAAYELISAGLANNVEDVLTRAHLKQSTGYAILMDLIVSGLIQRDGTTLALGKRSLDDVAFAHGLVTVATDRVIRHRAERLLWQVWLDRRFGPPPPDIAPEREFPLQQHVGDFDSDLDRYLASVVAEGPRDRDPTAEALELLHDQLGAVIVGRDSP